MNKEQERTYLDKISRIVANMQQLEQNLEIYISQHDPEDAEETSKNILHYADAVVSALRNIDDARIKDGVKKEIQLIKKIKHHVQGLDERNIVKERDIINKCFEVLKHLEEEEYAAVKRP